MSTQTAVQSRIVALPAAALVSVLKSRALTARMNFDTLDLQSIQSAPTASVDGGPRPMWLNSSPTLSTPRFRKGGAFALVVLVHALMLYALSHISLQVRKAVIEPLQVVVLSEPDNSKNSPPPLSMPRLQTFALPIEPPAALSIAEPETTSITVSVGPSEPTAAATADMAATPKVVSSVEYVREPAAKYPSAARTLKQHGTVTLRALIDVNGRAREVDVHRSSGYHLLDDAARKAVFEALFKPYTENGRTLPVYVFIPIEFGAAASNS